MQGFVCDAEQHPIIYATIQVLNSDKTLVAGAISDADGCFTATIPDGCRLEKLLVRISYVGYQTCEIVPEAYDMGRVILQQETQMLSEVNIVGKRPVYKLENGNIRTTVKNTLLSDVGKAIDVIGYLPGVWSDGRSITVLGKGAPVYYINNRRVRNMAEVDMLSSKQIESVEVVYNPGAEYDSSVQAVIKIKTIQRIGDYFGGEVEAGLMYAADWKYGGAANLNFRKNKTELFGNVEYEDGTQAEATLDTRTEAFTQKPWLTTSHYKSWVFGRFCLRGFTIRIT